MWHVLSGEQIATLWNTASYHCRLESCSNMWLTRSPRADWCQTGLYEETNVLCASALKHIHSLQLSLRLLKIPVAHTTVSYLEAQCNFLNKGGCLVLTVAYLLLLLIGNIQNSKHLPFLCVRVRLICMPLKNLAFVVTAVVIEMCVVMKTVKIDHNNV